MSGFGTGGFEHSNIRSCDSDGKGNSMAFHFIDLDLTGRDGPCSFPCHFHPALSTTTVGRHRTEAYRYNNKQQMVLFYDPFDVSEEEEFFEAERVESRRQVQQWIQTLQLSTNVVSSPNGGGGGGVGGGGGGGGTTGTAKIQDIQLHLPLERNSLIELVEALILSTSSSSSSSSSSAAATRIRLSFSHWGLSDEGIHLLLPLLQKRPSSSKTNEHVPIISHLSLKSCGITAAGFYQWMSSAISRRHDPTSYCHSSIPSLDWSRNPFLHAAAPSTNTNTNMLDHPTSPKELLKYTLTRILPKCTPSLQHLNLSSTGLYSKELMESVWQGLVLARGDTAVSLGNAVSPFVSKDTGKEDYVLDNDCCVLQSLDVSHNMDSLEQLLETLLEYLPRVSVRSLILTRGASSSTCLDYANSGHGGTAADGTTQSTKTVQLLERLIEQVSKNPWLEQLGPLSMLPLDRESPPQLQAAHARCRQLLDDLEHYHLQKTKYRRRYLYPLLWNSENENGCDTSRNETTAQPVQSKPCWKSAKSYPSLSTLSFMAEHWVGRPTPTAHPHVDRAFMNLVRRPPRPPPPSAPSRHSYSLVYWILQETSTRWANHHVFSR